MVQNVESKYLGKNVNEINNDNNVEGFADKVLYNNNKIHRNVTSLT